MLFQPNNMNEIEINRYPAPLPLTDGAVGFTLVQLTDFHLGFGHPEPSINKAIELTLSLSPDLIVLTGDYVDSHTQHIPLVKSVFSPLRAPLGVYATYGNHDHRAAPPVLKRILADIGIEVLNNSAVPLPSGLWLIGIDDLYEGEPDVEAALSDPPPDVPLIVLSHHPGMIRRLPDRPIVMLSGHTHGAQIRLPFPSPELVCWYHLRTRYVSGWYHLGQRHLYVNRGLGITGLPFRYNCPPEIACFDFKPKEALGRYNQKVVTEESLAVD